MSTMTLSPAPTAPPAPAQRRPRPAPEYRLTRRGRLVVLTLALVALFLVGVVLSAGSVATDERGTMPTEVVLVGPGETLWDIAAAASDGGDVRDMMERISRLNALESGMLETGQRLRVPTDGGE